MNRWRAEFCWLQSCDKPYVLAAYLDGLTRLWKGLPPRWRLVLRIAAMQRLRALRRGR